MYGIKINSGLIEFSTIDMLVNFVLDEGIDPSKYLYISGEKTNETIFEYMVA